MSLAPVTKRQAKYWFNRINKMAFDGQLSKTEIVFERTTEYLAATSRRSHWRVLGNREETIKEYSFTIRMNEKTLFSRSVFIQTLAHEMVHVEHWDWAHNDKFFNRVYEVIGHKRLRKFL